MFSGLTGLVGVGSLLVREGIFLTGRTHCSQLILGGVGISLKIFAKIKGMFYPSDMNIEVICDWTPDDWVLGPSGWTDKYRCICGSDIFRVGSWDYTTEVECARCGRIDVVHSG